MDFYDAEMQIRDFTNLKLDYHAADFHYQSLDLYSVQNFYYYVDSVRYSILNNIGFVNSIGQYLYTSLYEVGDEDIDISHFISIADDSYNMLDVYNFSFEELEVYNAILGVFVKSAEYWLDEYNINTWTSMRQKTKKGDNNKEDDESKQTEEEKKEKEKQDQEQIKQEVIYFVRADLTGALAGASVGGAWGAVAIGSVMSALEALSWPDEEINDVY